MELIEIVILLIPSLIMLMVWLWSWTHPPTWVAKLFAQFKEAVETVRTWGPRLAGAMARGTPESIEAKRAAVRSDSGLAGIIAQVVDIAPQIIPLISDPNVQELAFQLLDRLIKGIRTPTSGGESRGGPKWH